MATKGGAVMTQQALYVVRRLSQARSPLKLSRTKLQYRKSMESWVRKSSEIREKKICKEPGRIAGMAPGQGTSRKRARRWDQNTRQSDKQQMRLKGQIHKERAGLTVRRDTAGNGLGKA